MYFVSCLNPKADKPWCNVGLRFEQRINAILFSSFLSITTGKKPTRHVVTNGCETSRVLIPYIQLQFSVRNHGKPTIIWSWCNAVLRYERKSYVISSFHQTKHAMLKHCKGLSYKHDLMPYLVSNSNIRPNRLPLVWHLIVERFCYFAVPSCKWQSNYLYKARNDIFGCNQVLIFVYLSCKNCFLLFESKKRPHEDITVKNCWIFVAVGLFLLIQKVVEASFNTTDEKCFILMTRTE